MIDFEKEVAKYGKSLSKQEQDKAREVFYELLERGRSFEWLYYAIQRLEGRSILTHPKLLFYRPFAEEVDAMIDAAHEAERAKKERNREICAKIEAQIRLREEKERNMKIIFQPPKPKKKFEIDFAAIADMEDDVDGANPSRERICAIEKTDSKENLIRRGRGL